MKLDDISNLIEIDSIPVIIYNNLPNNSVIIKNNNNTKVLTKSFIQKNKLYLKQKVIGKHRQTILEFVDVLNSKLAHCNFENFKKNIKTIKILDKKPIQKDTIINGEYLMFQNKINLFNNKSNSTITHELLHLASNKIISEDLILGGFTINDFEKTISIGRFINEGYTEHLNIKYFIKEENKDNKSYKMERNFVKLLEKIVGNELMEKMYFNADLKGLIYELTKYNERNEVLNFILNSDKIIKYMYSFNPCKRFILGKTCIQMNDFLLKTYYKKLKSTYEDEKLIKEQFELFIKELKNINIDFHSNYRYVNKTSYLKKRSYF